MSEPLPEDRTLNAPMTDLNEMLIFTRVVECGSFSAAGRQLGIPKSTVSRKISLLEQRLATRLLQRTTRSVSLTDLGQAYYERCARVVQEAEQADDLLLESQGRPRGLLRVSAPVEFSSERMGQLVEGFLSSYPEVQLQLDLSNRKVNLVEEGFDIAIRAGNLEDSSLVARKLSSDRVCPMASPEYLRQRGEPRSPEELKNHQCILYSNGATRTSIPLVGPEGRRQLSLEGRILVNNMELARDCTTRGLGIGFLPAEMCATSLAEGLLQRILPQWSFPDGGIYAVYPSRTHLNPKVRAFVDLLVAEFGK